MQQAVFEFGACRFVKERRVELGLFAPQRIELGLDHGAVNVEVVAFVDAGFAVVTLHGRLAVARANGLPCQITLVEPLAYCAAMLGLKCGAQFADGCFQSAAVVVFFVGLAIALEATPLVDVKQSAGKFFGFQRVI